MVMLKDMCRLTNLEVHQFSNRIKQGQNDEQKENL